MEVSMKLSEVRNQQSRQQQNPGNAFETLGVIRNSAVYPQPIDALYEGQPVTLLATGDIVGMSPAVQIVDQDGRIDWVSSEDVTVTQRGILPQTQAQTQGRTRSRQLTTQQ
jgi:hypothetical protein